MLKRIENFINEYHLFKKNEYIICATSGGVDSVCLVDILYKLGFKVVLAHVNHHKRFESQTEQIAMENWAKNLKIPFELLNFYDEHKNNFHDEAHKARYDFFKSLTKKYNTKYITTAHHLDDQAENILIKLIAGSNLYGYGGISIKQEYDGYIICRPLLCVDKNELYTYAKQNNLTYFEDISNQELDYLRNRLRHQIIPFLKQENSDVLNKFQEFSIQAKEAFNFIRKQSINYLNTFKNNIEVTSFKDLDVALQKDIICLMFEQHNLYKSYDIINKCLELINSNKNKKLTLKNNYYFLVEYGFAMIKKLNLNQEFSVKLTLETDCFILNKYHIYFSKKIPQNNENYIKLCYNSLKLPFLIRNKKEGDFINMSFGKKKVNRILIDSKVANEERPRVPLIFDNDNNLLWVYNLAKSIEVINQKENADIFLICEEFDNEK